MSETLLVSIVTMLAGVGGASIGAISTYLVAKLSLRADQKKVQYEDRKKYYLAFIDAYNAYASVLASVRNKFGNEASDEQVKSAYITFQSACMAVSLLATKKTAVAANQLYLAMSQYGETLVPPKGINAIYNSTMDAMRTDLRSNAP